MGRERRKKRKYLYLCLAGALIVWFAGCRQVPEVDWQPPQERWEHLQPVQSRIETRDFEGAVTQYQRVLSDRGRNAQADLALFDLGLLYSHYANPRKDYKKSLSCFSRLIREYPQSPLMEEAKIWIHLLETLEKTQRVDIELEDQRRY